VPKNSDILVTNPNGKGVQQLTQSFGNNFDPTWSPDGQEIAFGHATTGSPADIYVMNGDGTDRKCSPIPRPIRSTPTGDRAKGRRNQRISETMRVGPRPVGRGPTVREALTAATYDASQAHSKAVIARTVLCVFSR